MKSPFKFLDSYTKDDREIFFGRDRETEELYQRVFESKLMLVYGVSGTGKSSLIHCGLANKFSETDWLPLVIRRGSNIINSMAGAIRAASITRQDGQLSSPAQFRKSVKSLYLDHYKPVFFIFDQFEELFIFGDKEERKSFIQIIKSLIESDLQCRLIFVMREEYMAGVTEFERYIPTFFANRVRIEKMAHINAIEAIIGPCKAAGISLEEGFPEALLEKLSPEGADVELTYLQVFLDKVFRLGIGNYPPLGGGQGGVDFPKQDDQRIIFTISLLSQTGNVSDLLGSFLEEQLKELDDPESGLIILKSFVSIKGTKKQLSEREILESSRSLGKNIPETLINELLQKFVTIRILRDKDNNDKYELRHDSLATKIYEKITLVEKEILEICQFLENAWSVYLKRNVLLSSNDLAYIAPYRDRLFVNREINSLIEYSEKELNKIKKRIKRVAISGLVAILIFSTGVIFNLYRLPFSGQLRSLGLIIYILWFLPVFAYYIFRVRENRTMNMIFLIFTLIFVGNTILYMKNTETRFWSLYADTIIKDEQKINSKLELYRTITEKTYNEVERIKATSPTIFNRYWTVAPEIKERTDEVFNYIQSLKIELIRISEGPGSNAIDGNTINISKISRWDENNVSSEVLVESPFYGKGLELKVLILSYKEDCIKMIENDPRLTHILASTLDLDDHRINGASQDTSEIKMERWEIYSFYGVPLGHVLITLTELQSDIKYCESELIAFVYSKMTEKIE